MVTVKPTPSIYQIIRNPEVSHWFINDRTIRNSYLNVFFSLLGYTLFAAILRTSYSKGVLRNHIHDVFLILIFACVTDLIEFRMHLQIIFDLQNREDFLVGTYKFIATSVGMCTMVTFVFFAHLWITYVEAIVSIYRFIVQFCGRKVPISYIYKALGVVFTLKAAYILATLVFGEPVLNAIYCTRVYMLNTPMLIVSLVWLPTVAVAPVLSLLMIIKGFVRKQHDAGTSVFILLSSLSMVAFVSGYLVHLAFGAQQGWVDSVTAVIRWLHDFRFLLLVLISLAVVDDIRDSVVSSINDTIRRLFGLQEAPTSISNDVFLAGMETKKVVEVNANLHSDVMLL